jgi:hypothetical protein
MKAQLYRESAVLASALKARGELDKYTTVCPDSRLHRMVPAGYIIDHPDAWHLVVQGTAKAADEECEAKAAMTSDQTIRRYERQIALENGELTGDPKIDVPHKRS